MTFLLDNNVLSELWKPRPNSQIIQWIELADWRIPSPVIAEIQEGAEACPSQSRRIAINAALDTFLLDFGGLVIDWDAETSRVWGRLRHSHEVKKKPQPLWDSLLDAMAVRHDMPIATRNKTDFRHAKIFDPWREPVR
jgi:toxin FitB